MGQAFYKEPKKLLRSEKFIDPQDRQIEFKGTRRRSVLKPAMEILRRNSTVQLIGDAPVAKSAESLVDAKRLEKGITYGFLPHPKFPTKFNKGLMRSIRIPVGGSYRIEATGAAAADVCQSSGYVYNGGHGVTIGGTFMLKEGTILTILCGAMSTVDFRGAGGGGGTFVAFGNAPLVVAGGGGGSSGFAKSNPPDGGDASLNRKGNDGKHGKYHKYHRSGRGGKDGQGGWGGPNGRCDGGGAGGYVVGGSSSKQMTAREEAQWIAENRVCKGGCSFLSGGFGCGVTGGFGGGGEAEEGHGGGGGGYSGGGGGAGAGGGGSYARSDAEMVKKYITRGTGAKTHGHVVIQLLTVKAHVDQRAWQRNMKAKKRWSKAIFVVFFIVFLKRMSDSRKQLQRANEAEEQRLLELWEADVRRELQLAQRSIAYRIAYRTVAAAGCCSHNKHKRFRPSRGSKTTRVPSESSKSKSVVIPIEDRSDSDREQDTSRPKNATSALLIDRQPMTEDELQQRVLEMSEEEMAVFTNLSVEDADVFLHMRDVENSTFMRMENDRRVSYLAKSPAEKDTRIQDFQFAEQIAKQEAERKAKEEAAEKAAEERNRKAKEERKRKRIELQEQNRLTKVLILKASELLTMWINEEVIVPRRNAETGVSNQAPFLWVRAVSHSLELLPELVARGLVPQSIVDSQRAKNNESLNSLIGKTLCPPHVRTQLLQFLNQPPKIRTPTHSGKATSPKSRRTSIRKGSKVGHQLIRMLQQDCLVECCICLDDVPIKSVAVCVFYVCGHFICSGCFGGLMGTEIAPTQSFHLCPMCRTPILQNAGTWVAHEDEAGQTYFYNSKTGETTHSRPEMSQKTEYWGTITGQAGGVFYVNRLTGEKTTTAPPEFRQR